jgi:uncharacterized protein YpbB
MNIILYIYYHQRFLNICFQQKSFSPWNKLTLEMQVLSDNKIKQLIFSNIRYTPIIKKFILHLLSIYCYFHHYTTFHLTLHLPSR